MKKKSLILSVALAASAIFALASCNGKEGTSTTSNVETPTTNITPETTPTNQEGTTTTSTSGQEGTPQTDIKEYEVVKTGFQETEEGSLSTFESLFNTVTEKCTVDSNTKLQDDKFEYGQFTFLKGIRFEKNCLNIQGDIKITTTVDNAVLKMKAPTGASGSGKTAYLQIINSEGTVLKETKPVLSKEADEDVELTLSTAGTYTITHINSVRIYSLIIEETKEKSAQSSIEAKISENAKFIVGALTTENAKQTIKNQISVKAKFENGSVATVLDNNFDIDISKVDLTKAGEYDVKVTSNNFEHTIKIKLFAVESLGIEEYYITSNMAENLRRVYVKGSELDKNNIIISTIAKCGTDSISSVVSNTNVTFDADLTTTGLKEVKVGFGGFENKFNINVVEDVIEDTATEVIVNVDKNATVSVTATNITFNTINDAIDYLELCAPATAIKTVRIAAGTYEEKVSINKPNIKLVGASKDSTIITYDGCAGMKDAKGIVYNNGGSAVVCSAASATNFEIENVSIINKNNDNYDTYISRRALYGSSSNGTQAIALYNQADKSIVKNCIIKSCHDTLFTKNRQYYENCDIYGTTDYIFGENTTAYFKSCTIITVTSDTIDGTSGYVGCNNTSTGYYGYVFDGCTFTHQGKVADGGNSLGRTWKADSTEKDSAGQFYASMKQIIINSTIDKSYNTGDNRYTEMNGYHTNPAWVLEFNNTGDGAISTASAETGIIATETEANALTALDTIFNNGTDTWTPGVAVVDKKTYVSFNGDEIASGTGTVFTDTFDKTSGTITAGSYTIAVDATGSKVAYRENNKDTQVNADAKMTFNVAAGSSVTISTYNGYHDYTLNGVAATADTFSMYFDEATEVVFKATNQVYLYTLTINPEASEADCTVKYVKPAENKLSAIEGLTLTEAATITWTAVDNATSYDVYLDDSTTPINVTTNTYTLTENGLHAISVVAKADGYVDSDKSNSIYAILTSDTALSNTTITFGKEGNYDAYAKTGLITCTSTVRKNGNNDSQVGTGIITIKVTAGSKVKIVAYNNSAYVSYTVTANETTSDVQNSDYEVTVTAGDVIITGTNNNNYYVSIIIE